MNNTAIVNYPLGCFELSYRYTIFFVILILGLIQLINISHSANPIKFPHILLMEAYYGEGGNSCVDSL